MIASSSQLPALTSTNMTAMRRNWPGVLLLLLIGIDLLAAQQPPPKVDAYIQRVMKTFTVPGLSVAIVKDGKVMLAKGYGIRRMGDRAPADARTRFGIASNTKLFTATALALLAEEGKIEWDKPVVDYLPAFAMSDPFVTRELTVRDLLVQRSGLGLGAGDLLWWPPSTYDRKEILRRLRHIPLATSFRSAYAYDNVLYLVAGEVIEAVSGQPWEKFVRNRILTKVGMAGSDVLHSAAGTPGNVAGTHAEVNDTVRPIAPAPEGLPHLRPQFSGYALGVDVRDYRGKFLLQHTGGLPGYLSKVAMLPELRLGVAVLTNQESGAAFESIVYHVLDHYLNVKPPDYPTSFKTLNDQNRAKLREAERTASAGRDSLSGPSLPLPKYAGTYRDPWYGDVVIAGEGRGLTVRFNHTP